MRGGWKGAVAASLVTLVARGAYAQSGAEVDALVRRAVALRQQSQDEAALAELQRALGLSREPRVLAQLGLAEQAVGRWLDADRHLEEAQRAAGDPWIARNRASLAEARRQVGAHLGRVMVFGAVAGAEVFANEQRLGVLPMSASVSVASGTNLIEVRAAGYVTMTRRVQVEAGAEARETFEMVREPSPAVRVTAAVPVPVVATVAAPPAWTSTMSAAPRSGARRALAWTSLAVGAAGLGVGAFAATRLVGAVSDYDTRRDPVCPGTDAAVQPTVCAGYLAEVETMRPLAVAGFVAGGALAITSVVLFATSPTGEERARAGAFRCGVGTSGVSCSGVF